MGARNPRALMADARVRCIYLREHAISARRGYAISALRGSFSGLSRPPGMPQCRCRYYDLTWPMMVPRLVCTSKGDIAPDARAGRPLRSQLQGPQAFKLAAERHLQSRTFSRNHDPAAELRHSAPGACLLP